MEPWQPIDEDPAVLPPDPLPKQAAIGRWIVIVVIALIALLELGSLGLALLQGQVKIGQLGRMCFTLWLLMEIWNGTAWARWLLISLFVVAGVGLPIVIFRMEQKMGVPELVPALITVAIVVAVISLGLAALLATPWVGAYQAVKRQSSDSL